MVVVANLMGTIKMLSIFKIMFGRIDNLTQATRYPYRSFDRLVAKFYKHPRRIFLIDAGGALLSAFLLGVILVRFEHLVGIPPSTLYFLALLPCLFALYDGYCFLIVRKNINLLLKALAFINVSYCLVSIGSAFYHHEKITFLGWTYILLEVFVVITLARFEFRLAKVADKKRGVTRTSDE